MQAMVGISTSTLACIIYPDSHADMDQSCLITNEVLEREELAAVAASVDVCGITQPHYNGARCTTTAANR